MDDAGVLEQGSELLKERKVSKRTDSNKGRSGMRWAGLASFGSQEEVGRVGVSW